MRFPTVISFLISVSLLIIQIEVGAIKLPNDPHFPSMNNKSRISNANESKTIAFGRYKTVIQSKNAAETKAIHLPQRCDINNEAILNCKYIKNLDFVLNYMTDSIRSLEISESLLYTLNFTLLHQFPSLIKISVTNSSLSSLYGQLPMNVVDANFSRNNLNLSASYIEGFVQESDFSQSEFKVEIIDLSHNNLETEVKLPKALFSLPKLKSLYLAGSHLEGQFVWGTMWEWVNDTSPILKDADDTLCVFKLTTFSLLGCLRAKTDFEETCNKIDTNICSSCALYALQKDLEEEFPNYPISHTGKQGSISLSLTLDCSNKSLTHFPTTIPIQTWKLDLYVNQIKDLGPIKKFPYVIYLDVANNSVKIESLLGTPFLNDFMSISLQNNNIRYIPDAFLKAVKKVQDKEKYEGQFYLGYNDLECNCSTATNTRRLINSMRNPGPDWKEIYCGNLKTPDGSKNLSLKDLKMFDVCVVHQNSDPDQQIWIYLIIGGEAILILFIVTKVWYDRRTFLRTGKLPWFSQKMPRLPCDAILEGTKDRRISNSGVTSNGITAIHVTNSRHHSRNSVHRSNSTATAGSRSNPSSSRLNLKIPVVRFKIHFKTSTSNSESSQATSHRSGDVEGSRDLLSTHDV